MTIKRLLGFCISLFAAAALGGPQAGCDSNVDEQLKLAVLGQDCLVNSDCKDPFLCAFELCHAACEESRDCPAGARCVGAARPYKVCQLEEERRCQRNRDCPEGLVCGVDGECRDSCETDAQCVARQSCVGGTCADPDELDEHGQLPVASSQWDRAEGAPCTYVSDCEGALLCREQVCLPECRADKDCPTGNTCEDSRCAPDGSLPSACDYHSECIKEDPGKRCLGGHCLCQCAGPRDCPTAQTCDGCGCIPAPDSCRINSDCTTPGQVCRDQRCDWECKKDVDCGSGRRCSGGGCVDALDPVDDIVTGSVQIGSTLQLERYRGVVEIHGDLTFDSIQLPSLGDALQDLAVVSGKVSVSNTALLELSLPKLQQAKEVVLSDDAALTDIDLPSLVHADFSVKNTPLLATLTLSSLQTSPSISILGAGVLSAIDLPSLTEIGELELMQLPALTLLQCERLESVAGSVVLDSLGKDEPVTIALPKLLRVGTVVNEASKGSIDVGASRIATLDGFGSATFQALVASIALSSNAPLTDCEAGDYIAKWTSADFEGATVKGNAACADGTAGAPAR
jgi:hypothetical protein